MTAIYAGDPAPQVLVPHWLTSAQRDELAAAIRAAIDERPVHPVAAARDAVWPASAARVRLATGWDADVLPVRLSAAELAGVLAVPTLPAHLRAVLLGEHA